MFSVYCPLYKSLPLTDKPGSLLPCRVQPNLFSIPDSSGPCPTRGMGHPAPGIEYSVKFAYPAPVSILNPDTVPTCFPSPESSCAPESQTPVPNHSRAVAKSNGRVSVFCHTLHPRVELPALSPSSEIPKFREL